MASIDNKVVSITFDNSNFEKNVRQTIQTLADLKSTLDFKSSSETFSQISDSANKVNFSAMASAIDNISGKFNALGAVAFSVINNITNRVVDAGIALTKAFTIEPVTTGFAEYELKLGAIQTIMAGSGESLEVVNQKLAELNKYSDETIYSFADMTQNIGKFTNAGLSLDQSVASIQGIANVAAISGANAEEASRAMYNFAQSLSAGAVKLIDWKSIENANMATAGFKTEIIESAVAAGTLTKSVDGLYTTLEGTPITATKGFNESLSEQWLTTEVLNETLGRYSDTTTEIGKAATAAATDVKTFSQLMDVLKEAAGSGWATSSELIFGDFNEAKSLFTGMNDLLGGMIGDSANARNAVLSDWKELGGRQEIFEGLLRTFDGFRSILIPIKDAFREIFPKKTGQDLFELSQAFNNFGKKLQNVKPETIDKIKTAFKGLFAGVSIFITVFKGIISIFTNLFKTVASANANGFLTFLAKIGSGIIALRNVLVEGGKIEAYFEKINSAISKFVSNIDLSGVVDGFNKFVSVVRSFAPSVGKAILSLVDNFKTFFNALNFNPLITAISSVKNAFQSLFSGGKEDVIPSNAEKKVSKFATVFLFLGDAIKAVGSFIGSIFNGIATVGGGIGTIANGIGTAVEKIWGAIASVFSGSGPPSMDTILKVLASGALGALSAALISYVRNGFKFDFGLFDVFKSISESIDSINGVLGAMQKDIIAGALLKIAIAIGILTLSLIALSFVDGIKLAKSMTAVSAGVALLIGALVSLDKIFNEKTDAKKLAVLAVSMVAIAAALLLVAIAARLMATADPESIAVGLAGMSVVLLTIANAMEKITKKTDGMIKAAFSIGVLAISLTLLAIAVKAFASIDMLEMAISIFAISSALTVISETMGEMKTEGMVAAATSIGILSIALIILATAIKQFSNLGIVDAVTGVTTMAIVLAIISNALKYIAGPHVKDAGISLLAVSYGMNLMVKAIQKMGQIGLWELIKGISAFALILLVLAKAMDATEAKKDNAVALLLVAAALTALAYAVKIMGSIPFLDLVQGLAGFFAVIGGMAILANIISPLLPLMTGLGVALALVGLAALGFGAGIYLMAAGIALIAKAGPKGLVVFLESLDDLLNVLPKIAVAFGEAAFTFVTSFLSGFDTLIPMIVQLITLLIDSIITLTPKIVTAALTIVSALLLGIRTIIPDLVNTGWEIILAFIGGIENHIEELVTAGLNILTNFINGIADNVGDLVAAAGNLVTEFIAAIGTYVKDVISAGTKLITDLIDGIGDAAGDIITAGADAIIDFLAGVASNVVKVVDAGFQIVIDMLNGIANSIEQNRGDLAAAGLNIIKAVFGGITGFFIDVLLPWVTRIPNKLINAIGNALTILKDVGKDLIEGLWNGIYDKFINWMKDKLGWLWGLIPGWIKSALGINSPSKVMYEIGKWIPIGLGNGILSQENLLKDASEGMGNAIVNGFNVDQKELTNPIREAVASAVSFMQNMDEFDGPIITPVLDLSRVQKDAKSLNKYLDTDSGFNSALVISAATNAARDTATAANQSTTEIKYEQNVYAPTPLSTNDIYRQTRSLIALTKEEASIP